MGITDSVTETSMARGPAVPCPACGTPFTWPPSGPCERCGADLVGPVAADIYDLDRRAAAIREQREAAVEVLRTAAAATVTPDLPPPSTMPVPPRPRRTSRMRPQVFLAAAGAVLLLAAAIVFIAVTWPTWPASAQAAFVALLTAAGAIAARAAARRELPVTADAIGVLTLAVAAYSLVAARTEGLAGLDGIDPTLWFTVVMAAAAGVARPFTTWAGLRDTPRRLGATAAVVAGGSGLAWLVDVVTVADPAPVLIAAAPTLAVILLLHGRWVLRPDDGFRHATRAVPAVLATGAAIGTGLVSLDTTSVVPVLLGAVVGLPALVWLRQRRPASTWTLGGATVAVLWVVQLTAFLLADALAGSLGLAAPRLVTVTVAAVAVGVAARLGSPASHWRPPLLVGTSVALLPAVGWTLGTWAERAEVVTRVLEAPFTGWPVTTALAASDLVQAAAAVVGLGLVVERLWPRILRPVLLVAASAAVAVAAVAGAAAGTLPESAPLLLAGAAAAVAATRWARDAGQWLSVAASEVAAIGLALVDLELFAITTAVVAVHLIAVAAVRRGRVTAALGVAAGLVAVASTSDAVGWSTPVTTLLVTGIAGTVMVWAQFARACRPWRATATDVVVLVAAAAATAVAGAEGDATVAAVQLAIVAVVAAVHAVRPGRGWAVWLSSLAASGTVWTLLGDRGVDVVEAYTLPSAVALAVAGGWRLHTTATSSWAACWPACLMASLPTLGVLVDGPDPTRVLLLTSGAVAVALLGHWRRLAAPLAIGAVVAIITSLLQLYDWTAHLPRWVTFGTLGVLLIWASATYEAQLRRARGLRRHLASLR